MAVTLIFVLSILAAAQFFVSYCHSLVVDAANYPLSEDVKQAAGINGHPITGDDFPRLLQLIRLCPDLEDSEGQIRAVRAYYGLVNVLRAILRPLAPTVAAWAEGERVSCAYFAAVVLDQRIAYSRELVIKQSGF